jgi:TRAP-type C4-dicarboxylate transport system substrate-binding protein
MIPRIILCIGALLLGIVRGAGAAADELPAIHLKIVGGLGDTSQYIEHEEPFWTKHLAEASQGRVTAEVSPFDGLGIHGSEVTQLMRLGVIGFGTTSLSLIAGDDPEAAAVDLVGMNPDIHSLRENVEAYRGTLTAILEERYGIELLAVFTYPAQVIFCNKPIGALRDLKGLKVRTASAVHSDFVETLGAIGVTLPYAATADALRKHVVDCAITGTMSGYRSKLYEITTHIHAMTLSWGPNVFLANGTVWKHLDPRLQAFLKAQLKGLEDEIWAAAERETDEGIACNTGRGACRAGTPGHMNYVAMQAEDIALAQSVLSNVILPRWAERCGVECARGWNATIGRNVGLKAPSE